MLQSLPEMKQEHSRQQILELAGLEGLMPLMDLSGAPLIATTQIIVFLANYGKISYEREALGVYLNLVKNLVGLEQKDYLDKLIHKYQMISSDIMPNIDKWDGKENIDVIHEKIIGENTLRPIAFLTQGILVSKAICYIGVKSGSQQWSGTGFMITNNLLITCNHVIPSVDLLQNTIFRFNYEENFFGESQPVTEYRCPANHLFFTSEELDFTIIEIGGDAGKAWGHLKISENDIKRGDRVNIIQHPDGQPKRISLQNNYIEYIDSTKVQYLTSTLPGSSGSPVFSDSWEVIAIHHSGGNLREPNTNKIYFRNEGILLKAVIEKVPSEIRTKILGGFNNGYKRT